VRNLLAGFLRGHREANNLAELGLQIRQFRHDQTRW